MKIRPISTAPRDGTAIIIYPKNIKFPDIRLFTHYDARPCWQRIDGSGLRWDDKDCLGWYPLPEVEG